MRAFRLLLVAGAASVLPLSSFAATNAWFAASGLLPEQTTTNWVLGDTAAANPTLSGGHMLLSTAANSEAMYYRQTANLSIPANWTIEFRAKFDSRNAAINYNSGMSVFFTTAPYVGNILYFRQDDLWLANGLNVRGPGVALDTDSAFHTYRIELSGASFGSAIKVFYDNGPLPVLMHQLVGDPSLVGAAARIGFGDGTAGDSGTSEWEYFWHNGSAVSVVPEPATTALLIVGGMALGICRRGNQVKPPRSMSLRHHAMRTRGRQGHAGG
jgi:hypothetical protein